MGSSEVLELRTDLDDVDDDVLVRVWIGSWGYIEALSQPPSLEGPAIILSRS